PGLGGGAPDPARLPGRAAPSAQRSSGARSAGGWMSNQPRARWENGARRNERIRELRAQRQASDRRPRRRFQPIVLLLWLAGVAALAAFLLFIGFLAFAPRLMSWVEENPSSIKQGIVLDFVRWYQPSAIADTPASDSSQRITFQVPTGATDTDIGHLLFQKGLVRSELAFQFFVIAAGREGRSEEHTSELQSLRHLVCRLLLEKKK